MTDLATLRAAHEAGLTDAVRREVVVQHEGVFEGSLQRIDHRCIALGTQRGSHDRLSFTPGEER